MIILGLILILLSLLFEHLSNKDSAQGIAPSDSYKKMVKIMRGFGIGFCIAGVLFWILVLVLSVIAAGATAL
jgi:hypothetical protein